LGCGPAADDGGEGEQEVGERAAGESAPTRFEDVTQRAGIDFTHTSGQSGRKFIVETIGAGAAFIDYDGDGNLDLYVVNGADLPGHTSPTPPKNALYRNDGDGSFANVADDLGVADETYGIGCVVGDYDNDGDSDLFVANYGRNKLYKNGSTDGRAVFTDISAATLVGAGAAGVSTGAAFADYDLDGDLDLFVATYLRYAPEDDALDDSGKLAKPRRYLAPTEYAGGRNFLFRNDGADQFSDVTRPAGLYTTSGRSLGAVFFDYDNDGDPDLFQANDATPNFLYRNVGGHFTEIGLEAGIAYGDGGVPEGSMGIDVDDIDADGDADIVLTNFQWESNRLYANSGDGHFRDASRKAGLHATSLEHLAFGINLFDADNDGDQDLFVANGHIDDDIARFDPSASYRQQDQLYVNDGTGHFADMSSQAGAYFGEGRVGRGSAVGDYDNDGDGDLFISNSNDRAVLLRNESPGHNNWLALRLRGVRSNRDGVGARVDVTAGPLVQSTEARTATSYLSQDDPRLYFGLGVQDHVEAVRVRWPSGIVQELHDIAVNEVLLITEPDIEPPERPRGREEDVAAAAAGEPTVRLMHLLAWSPLKVPGHKADAAEARILPPDAATIDSLQAIVASGKPSAAAHRELGEALRLNRRAREARSQLVAALELDGKHAPSYISLGKLELTMGRAAEAAKLFQKAAALVPDDGKPLSLLGYLAVRSQAFDRAIEFYEGALRRDASLVRVYANLARAYERQANPAEAVVTLRRGLKVAPRDIDMRLYLADICLSRAQYDLAEEQLETILDIDPGRTEAIILMSTVNRLEGDVEEAIELLETGLERDSTDVAIKRQLGLLLLDSGESDKVIAYLEAAMSQDPDEPEVCYALASAYREHGDEALAQLMLKYFGHLRNHYKEIVAHRSALSLNRSDSQAFFDLGILYAHLGRLEAARQSFAYCLRMRPDHIEALNEIGGIYLRRRDLHQAIVTLGEVVSRDSTYARAWESLGSALMFNGDPDKARGALERAVQLDKTAADPHMALAQIYRMQGHDSQAKRHIETYRRLAPKARQSDKGHHHSQVDEAGARSQPQGR
jgi:tetratricopeptide (TPR) repeat protein